MKDFIELDKILELCRDRRNYPPVFKYTDGSDIELPGYKVRAGWIEKDQPRKITLEITSYIGTSWDAEHFYGNLTIEGVSFSKEDDYNSYISDNNTRALERENPLAETFYKAEMVRPLTQKEIDESPNRWKWMHEGSLTNSYNSIQEVIDAAIKICKARFEGNWELCIKDYVSYNDDIIIQL